MNKRKTASLLLAALLFAGCAMRSADQAPESGDAEAAARPAAAEEETLPAGPLQEEETEAGEEGPPPAPEFTQMKTLELEEEPVYLADTLILRFTDHEVWYEDDDEAMIGVISGDGARSCPARIVTKNYPELMNGEDYRGAALIPEEPLEAGSFNFTVTIGRYLVSFTMTVQ